MKCKDYWRIALTTLTLADYKVTHDAALEHKIITLTFTR